MTFIFAESVDEVFAAALEPLAEAHPAPEPAKKRRTARKKETTDAENHAG